MQDCNSLKRADNPGVSGSAQPDVVGGVAVVSVRAAATGVSVGVGVVVAGSGAIVGAGAAVGVLGGGDIGVLVGVGVLASSVAPGGAPSSPEFSGPKIAMMTTSAIRPTNPTPTHLSALLNTKLKPR